MRAKLVVLLIVLAWSNASSADDDFLSLNPFPGGRGITTPASRQLDQDAQASKQALAAADANLAARHLTVPDQAYVDILQRSFQSNRPALIDPNDALPFSPTTDPNILSNSKFAANLQRLFQLQAQSISTPPAAIGTPTPPLTLSAGDSRVIGGLPIPSALDVVGIVGIVPEANNDFCSGEIIGTTNSSTAILTAAHCVCESSSETVRVGQAMFTQGAYRAYLVRQHTFLYNVDPCPVRAVGEDIDVYRVAVEKAVAGRDIAVLLTDAVIDPNLGRARPILGATEFANWMSPPPGTPGGTRDFFVRAVGYGFTAVTPDGFGTGQGYRLFADIAVVAPSCTTVAAQQYACATQKQLDELVAAGRPLHEVQGPTPDTCGGDSGGPIYASVVSGGQTSFYTIGITSRGTPANQNGASSSSCGAGGIYSLVTSAAVTNWLQTTFNAQIKG